MQTWKVDGAQMVSPKYSVSALNKQVGENHLAQSGGRDEKL